MSANLKDKVTKNSDLMTFYGRVKDMLILFYRMGRIAMPLYLPVNRLSRLIMSSFTFIPCQAWIDRLQVVTYLKVLFLIYFSQILDIIITFIINYDLGLPT